jgi:hypothetical protein
MPIESWDELANLHCRRMPSWLGGPLEFRHTGRTSRWQRPAYAGPPCKTAPYTVVVPIYPPDPTYRCKPMVAPEPLDAAWRSEQQPLYRCKPVSPLEEPTGEESNTR